MRQVSNQIVAHALVVNVTNLSNFLRDNEKVIQIHNLIRSVYLPSKIDQIASDKFNPWQFDSSVHEIVKNQWLAVFKCDLLVRHAERRALEAGCAK